MVFTGIVSNIDLFNLPSFLFITPMFLFRGTFFPMDSLPQWAQTTALFFPLPHLVTLCREICCGSLTGANVVAAVLSLAGFSAVFFSLALFAMRRRLVK